MNFHLLAVVDASTGFLRFTQFPTRKSINMRMGGKVKLLVVVITILCVCWCRVSYVTP